MQTTDYEKQATDFLAASGLEFKAVHLGSDCPKFCEDAEKLREMDKRDIFPRKSHIHGHHYHIMITGKDRGEFTIDFWNSYADEFHNWALRNRALAMDSITTNYRLGQMVKDELRKGKQRFEPTPYDVLACITKYDPGTFADFCSDFGYDVDSRKAESIYFGVQEEWAKVRRFFKAAELEQMAEIS